MIRRKLTALAAIPTYLAVLAAVMLATVPASPLAARTIAVPQEFASISGALNAARSGDIVLVGCGTYREHNLKIKPGVSLWSATLQPSCAIIDAEGRGRLLEFSNCDSTTAVVGLTLRGGKTENDGGAIVCRNAGPRLSRCVLDGCEAKRGGAVAASGSRGPLLEDCVITNNVATLQGGGVFWAASSSGRILRCQIENNTALAGGAVAVAVATDVAMGSCTLRGNRADASGGGLWVSAGAPRLRNCVIAENEAGLGGAGIACQAGQPILVTCTIADNRARALGGALLVVDSAPRLERTILAFNTPAAVACEADSIPSFAGCNIYGHEAGDWTGPIADAATLAGNLSADPEFCRSSSDSYRLREGSPCLPTTRGGERQGRIGARGKGCN